MMYNNDSLQVARANGDTLQFKVLSTSLNQYREPEREPEEAVGPVPTEPQQREIRPTEPQQREIRAKETEELSEMLELREICPDPNTAIAMPDKVEETVQW